MKKPQFRNTYPYDGFVLHGHILANVCNVFSTSDYKKQNPEHPHPVNWSITGPLSGMMPDQHEINCTCADREYLTGVCAGVK